MLGLMREHALHSTCMPLLGYNSLWAYHTIAVPRIVWRFQMLCVHFIHLLHLGLWAKSPCSLTLDVPNVSMLGI